jgi:hypothetical protein
MHDEHALKNVLVHTQYALKTIIFHFFKHTKNTKSKNFIKSF